MTAFRILSLRVLRIILCRGLRHQYVWATVAVRPTNMGQAVGKFDVESGEVKVWQEPGGLAGETRVLLLSNSCRAIGGGP